MEWAGLGMELAKGSCIPGVAWIASNPRLFNAAFDREL
jgi:hypothetical protein